MTYYLLVALFPALAALISVYGLVENPAGMTKDVSLCRACFRHRLCVWLVPRCAN